MRKICSSQQLLSKLALSVFLVLLLSAPVFAAAPTATPFSATASTVGATLLQLQGADADGTALTYAIGTSPSHGTLSGLATSTGYVVYTPTSGYTGSDTFTYTVTSGGDTTSPATVTLTVTNAKTRIVDTLIGPDGSARTGKVTFILTQKVWSPAGLIPVSATVTGVLNSSGQFDVSVYPSSALSPTAYYQVWYESLTGRRELIGVYNIPASSASSVLLSPYAVTNAALAAQYTFLSAAMINSLATGLAGAVTTFNGRTGAISPATNDYTWAQINKATSSLADITTRSAADLSSGQLGMARLGSLTDTALPYKTSSALADSPILRYGADSVGFASGTVAAAGSSQTTARIVLYPGASSEYLGIGVDSGKFWFNNGTAGAYHWYWGGYAGEQWNWTPSTFQVYTATNTYTLDFQTSGTTTTGALIFNTNNDTIRLTPHSTGRDWNFVSTSSANKFYATGNNPDLGQTANPFRYLHLSTGIKDTNGNLLVGATATTSAVNYFQMANAATGNGPSFNGVGSDSNITMHLRPKGTGTVAFHRGSDDYLGVYTDGVRMTAYEFWNSNDTFFFGNSSLRIAPSQLLGWVASGSPISGTLDTTFERAAPSVVGVTNASTGGGTMAFKPCSPSQITGNQNNYNPGCSSHYLRLNTDASRNLTGMVFSTAQVDGQTHVIVNVGSADIVLKHQDAASTDVNRFLNSTGADITLTANQMADCWYDGTTQRWRVSKRN